MSFEKEAVNQSQWKVTSTFQKTPEATHLAGLFNIGHFCHPGCCTGGFLPTRWRS